MTESRPSSHSPRTSPVRAIAGALLLAVFAGCTPPEAAAPAAAPAAPTTVLLPAPIPVADAIFAVTLATTPSGATVRLSGAELGTTPYVLKYRAATTVEVSLDGYLDEDVHVDANSDPNIIIVLHPDPAGTGLGPVATAPSPPRPRSAASSPSSSSASSTTPPASPSASPSASEPAKPKPSSSGLPYPNVASAKADYQAGRIDRDAYDQAVRKLKVRRADKIAVIRAKYQAGEIDKDEYARRKRIIDNEYRGT